jgi:hypothetical protein
MKIGAVAAHRMKICCGALVANWPKADIGWCTAHVRFRGQSGHSITSDKIGYRKKPVSRTERVPMVCRGYISRNRNGAQTLAEVQRYNGWITRKIAYQADGVSPFHLVTSLDH